VKFNTIQPKLLQAHQSFGLSQTFAPSARVIFLSDPSPLKTFKVLKLNLKLLHLRGKTKNVSISFLVHGGGSVENPWLGCYKAFHGGPKKGLEQKII
jgi:hypothetical protein